MQRVFSIDGIFYDAFIPTGGLKRSAAVLDGENAGRVKSGRMVRDIIGTYYNYSLTIQTQNLKPNEYDRLYETLTAPVDSHRVVFPYGQRTISFDAYVSNVDDVLKDMSSGTNVWGDLTVNFIAMEPNRT